MPKPSGFGSILDELMGKERDVPVHLVRDPFDVEVVTRTQFAAVSDLFVSPAN